MANLRLMESVMELRPTVTLVTAMRGILGFEIARDQRPDLVGRFGRGPTMPSSLRRPVQAVMV